MLGLEPLQLEEDKRRERTRRLRGFICEWLCLRSCQWCQQAIRLLEKLNAKLELAKRVMSIAVLRKGHQ